MKRRRLLNAATAALLISQARRAGSQQPYPSRPVTVLVGGAPGSVPDVMFRALAERLSLALGQAVVVENKPGAAGGLAMSALARSAPDGHTLALATMSQAVFNSYLFANLPYDPLRDLEPVVPLVNGAMVLAAHTSSAPRSLQEFVDLARAQRGKLFVAIPQAGSPPHIVALLLNRAAGIEVTLVPHKSGSDAVNAVVSGQIPFLIDAPTIVAGQVQAGTLKALAVTGRQREAALPDTPTLSESGYDVQGEAWIGLVAPAGTPATVVNRLNRELGLILSSAQMRQTMSKLGFHTMASTPEDYRALIETEHVKWGALIRQAGLKLD